jgi:hypothetical protein
MPIQSVRADQGPDVKVADDFLKLIRGDRVLAIDQRRGIPFELKSA